MPIQHTIRTTLRTWHPPRVASFSESTSGLSRAHITRPLTSTNHQHFKTLALAMSSGEEEQKPASLSVMAQAYDLNKPTFDIPLDNKGTILKCNLVISSAVKNPSSLITGLSELLRRPADATNDLQTLSTSAPYWTLESTNDSIIRVFAFEAEEQARLFRDRISAVSDEMDHHARMSVDSAADSSNPEGKVTRMTVTCTTHRPPGLSMRDIRLARKINEIAEGLG
ncbi:hypothetical protein EPUS_02304 [Endocarpon pusillum Z07020]|uniref:4a-hydroxytetrahydrobiopterin dehydratase n=1 Tax=Endocarpon pusillum (strain Z07020 / HMAS-L-300199) TaxID=1263415 RepID=U1I0M8_ENDPU|nr:uncharacterized protein EPUS_02304 [Endocarpon pusillum Z07020]ERF76765.1 hypothetical protein EPUS_02304 [Endocarpon pusillum Z07020]